MYRWLSILIGYLLGSFLTAEVVAHKLTGESVSHLGDTGNPGMANVMASLGFIPGIITLAGDLGKTILSAVITYCLFKPAGKIVLLYAGLGCTLGHDFPFWRKFRGGKGVATTSMAVVIYSFPWGLLANIAGMMTVFLTKYLCIGGPVIPAVFAVVMLMKRDVEAGMIGIVLTTLALIAHGPAIADIRRGKTKQTDVVGVIRRHFRGSHKSDV